MYVFSKSQMECQYLFNTRSRYGMKCGKINCINHDPYNCNMAKYMKLPKYFHKIGGKICKELYFKLIKLFTKLDSEEVEDFDETHLVFRILLNHSIYSRDIKLKELFFISMYGIIDSSSILNKNAKLRKVADFKYIEFTNSNNSEFVEYMRSNIVTGKRFYFVRKNKEYREKTFKTYVKAMIIGNKWFQDMIETRYSPSGNGQIEAKKSFDENYFRYHENM